MSVSAALSSALSEGLKFHHTCHQVRIVRGKLCQWENGIYTSVCPSCRLSETPIVVYETTEVKVVGDKCVVAGGCPRQRQPLGPLQSW
jgi:hypothetical protein